MIYLGEKEFPGEGRAGPAGRDSAGGGDWGQHGISEGAGGVGAQLQAITFWKRHAGTGFHDSLFAAAGRGGVVRHPADANRADTVETGDLGRRAGGDAAHFAEFELLAAVGIELRHNAIVWKLHRAEDWAGDSGGGGDGGDHHAGAAGGRAAVSRVAAGARAVV